ncbi:PAS domain-containing hybrid sensor histidine kinase/response regulator [Gemmatimonas phototrophica]|uniref:PAS domain-containing hybrid sensor histidine kinase/response regulator n=1 Tax=Gemmatimonas phototrophica TaxID=1379270 RepID=UPI0011AE4634|nr:PAS domain S-box protein [Gemmatimonas phototrophica]
MGTVCFPCRHAENPFPSAIVSVPGPLIISSELLARAAEENAGVLYITDLDHGIVWANAAFVRATGYTLQEVAGINPGAILVAPNTPPLAVTHILESLNRGERVASELVFRRKDGSLFNAALAIGPLKDASGQVIGFQTNVMDISAVRAAERRLSGILEGTRAGTWEWKIPTGETRLNERWAEMLGYTLDELHPISIATWNALAHPDDLPLSTQLLERHLSGQSPHYDFVCRMRHKQGHWVWVHDRGQVIEWADDGTPLWMAGTHIDVSEMIQTAEALRQSRDRAQHVLDTVQSVLVSVDATGCVTQINHAGCELFSLDESQILRRNWFTDLGIFAQGAPLLQRFLRVIGGGVPLAPWTEHVVLTRKAGSRLLRWHHVLLRDEEGTGIGVLSSGEDITELRLLERLSSRRDRLESIGTLAGGIAHDLNNALSPAVMGMELLREAAPSEGALLDLIDSSTQRAAQMVRQLLAYAKGAEGERRSVDLTALIQEVERLIRTTFPKNLVIAVNCPDEIPNILGDATQVHQILLNLAVNARDAMPEGGALVIEVEVMSVDAEAASRVSTAAVTPGPFVHVAVRDSGAGIAEGDLDRIFDPFFTTKGPERGTGLGLSTVLGIVKGHGGFLRVESVAGAGSTFHVYLPVPDQVADAPPPLAVRETSAREQFILFVDDEPLVRSVAMRLAQRIGRGSLTASSANEALALLAKPDHGITTVVTDLHMPGQDGLSLTREIRERWPELPVVIVSGLVTDDLWQQVRAFPRVTLLPKPFSEQQLRAAVELTAQPVLAVTP